MTTDPVLCNTVEDVVKATPRSGHYPIEAWPLRGSAFFTVGYLWAWPNGSRKWRLLHDPAHPYTDAELAGRRIGARFWMPGEPREANWPAVVAYMQAAVEAFPGQIAELRYDGSSRDPYDGDVMDSVHASIVSVDRENVRAWIDASDRIHRTVERMNESLVGEIALHVEGVGEAA